MVLDDESLLLVKTMFSNTYGCTVEVQIKWLTCRSSMEVITVLFIYCCDGVTSINFREDPGSVKYSQENLRPHLLQCFEFQEFSLFPRVCIHMNACVLQICASIKCLITNYCPSLHACQPHLI